MARFYPKQCPKCGGTDFKTITTREQELICAKPGCKTHVSLTSYTPCHHMKLSLWVFGFLYREALLLHPQPLTSTHIQRKLGVGRSTATTLKRRLQIFCSDLIPAVKEIMVAEIRKDFDADYRLPHKDVDITAEIKGKSVVYSDTMALFSVSKRANGHRSRHKHNGQTSSIYLTPEVAIEKGYAQVGTLVHTLTLKGRGLTIFTSVSNQRQETIEPILEFLPPNAPHMSDEGFPYFARLNENYRAINHSARALNGKRNVWARGRWSKNGITSQPSEGCHRIFKTYMRAMSFVSCKFSQLEMNQFSANAALRSFGEGRIIAEIEALRARIGECGQEIGKLGVSGVRNDRYLQDRIEANFYIAPNSPLEQGQGNLSKTSKVIPKELKQLLKLNDYFECSQAVEDYYLYYFEKDSKRKQKENEFNAYALRLFKFLKNNETNSLKMISNASSIPYFHCLRIVRIWNKLGIASVEQVQRPGQKSLNYIVKPIIPVMPSLLYTYDREDLDELNTLSQAIPIRELPPLKGRKQPKYGLTKEKRKAIIKEKNI